MYICSLASVKNGLTYYELCYSYNMSKIIAVIPTYNSADLVALRVKELLQSNFYKIIVCDDMSSDNTVDLLHSTFGDTIEVIAGQENRGPGGNRNRILTTAAFKDSDYTFFLDADCKVVSSEDISEIVKNNFKSDDTGVVGFGLLDENNEPMQWNYGELMHPVHEAGDQVLENMLEKGEISKEQFIVYAPKRAASFRMLPESSQKEVGWVAEGCFAVRSRLYEQIKGFAPAMRYHETHDLNARIQKLGYKTIFSPIVVAQHLAHDSRMKRREEDIRSGRLYYYQTHWKMNEEVFSHLFDENTQ